MSEETEKKPLTWEEALSLIGTQHAKGLVMGVDPCPPKQRSESVYLVISNPGQQVVYERVGA